MILPALAVVVDGLEIELVMDLVVVAAGLGKRLEIELVMDLIVVTAGLGSNLVMDLIVVTAGLGSNLDLIVVTAGLGSNLCANGPEDRSNNRTGE